MRKLFISLCFSACCSLLAAQTTNPIQEAMANYDYETALMLIDQETPTVPLLYQKGKALKGLGNNLEALSVFQEVVAQDSLNPRAYIEAAECCKSLAKYSEALDYYQNALHINPDNKYARIQYISLLMIMKEMIRPYRHTPSARPTKIRDLPRTLESSLIAPRAALAALATAIPPPMQERPVTRAAAM